MKSKKWMKRILLGAAALAVLLVALTLVGGMQARKTLEGRRPESGNIADLGEGGIFYQVQGHGDATVIMEAGQNEGSWTWCKVAPEIARRPSRSHRAELPIHLRYLALPFRHRTGEGPRSPVFRDRVPHASRQAQARDLGADRRGLILSVSLPRSPRAAATSSPDGYTVSLAFSVNS